MKKWITLLLFICLVFTCLCISASAKIIKPDEPDRWTNIVSVDGTLGFRGNRGTYNMVIEGASGVNRITAVATLYFLNSSGNWGVVPMNWSYDVNDDELIINESFTGVSGRTYKVVLSATVYKNGVGESINRTDLKVCP